MGIGDWESGWASGIRLGNGYEDWGWALRTGMGVRIGDGHWGLGLGMGLGYGGESGLGMWDEEGEMWDGKGG